MDGERTALRGETIIAAWGGLRVAAKARLRAMETRDERHVLSWDLLKRIAESVPTKTLVVEGTAAGGEEEAEEGWEVVEIRGVPVAGMRRREEESPGAGEASRD